MRLHLLVIAITAVLILIPQFVYADNYRILEYDVYQTSTFIVHEGDRIIVDIRMIDPSPNETITTYFQQWGGDKIYFLNENATNVSYDVIAGVTENWILVVENNSNSTVDVIIEQRIEENTEMFVNNSCLLVPTLVFHVSVPVFFSIFALYRRN